MIVKTNLEDEGIEMEVLRYLFTFRFRDDRLDTIRGAYMEVSRRSSTDTLAMFSCLGVKILKYMNKHLKY